MIPVLFDASEKKFTTNGIGRLSDATLCNVTEERNGIYELELRYPVTGTFFPELRNSRIICVIPGEGKPAQPFRIYKISKPLSGIITVYAEHISYQLAHIPVSPFKASGAQAALAGLKNNAAEECPFRFWTDKTTVGTFSVDVPSAIRAKLGGSRGSILDVFGGEYEFDGYDVRLYNSRGADNGVSIRYGKNLTDLKQEESIQNTITGIYPYCKTAEGDLITLPEKTVSAENAAAFPFRRTIPVDFSSEFDGAPGEAQLRNRAQKYLKDNRAGIPSVNLTVSFQQLWQTEEYAEIAPVEHVSLCDTVHVEYPELDVFATAKVNKTVYDVLLERYDHIELGDVRSSLATTFAEQKQMIEEQKQMIEEKPSKTFLQQAILEATEQITGSKGGYIVFRHDGNKKPYEMLIMDTEDIRTARNVWRFNQAGFGHSSNGYNGPYSTAITQNGAIVADFITTGSLMAGLIKAGTIADLAGKNAWNIETGEFNCKALNITGGKINIETTDSKFGLIRLKSTSIEQTMSPSSMTIYTDTDKESGQYFSMSSNGFEAGDVRYGFGTVLMPVAYIRMNKETRRFEMGNTSYPSFSFKTADGKTVTVKDGCIQSVS